MTRLARTILRRISEGRIAIGVHADNRLEERGITRWQIEAAASAGQVTVERPAAKPHPAVEIDTVLPDGTRCKMVWSLVDPPGAAKLVTIHYHDRS